MEKRKKIKFENMVQDKKYEIVPIDCGMDCIDCFYKFGYHISCFIEVEKGNKSGTNTVEGFDKKNNKNISLCVEYNKPFNDHGDEFHVFEI